MTQRVSNDEPTTAAPTTRIGITSVNLAVDCESVSTEIRSAAGYMGDVFMFNLSGRVVASSSLDDLSGIALNIELGPSDTFLTDLGSTGSGNTLSVVTEIDGRFSISDYMIITMDTTRGLICNTLGYLISITGVNAAFTSNSPDMILSFGSSCTQESSCIMS